MKRYYLKQLLVSLICITMLLNSSVFASNVDADDLTVQNNTVSYTESFEITVDTAGIVNYMFIYDSNNEWFVNNLIGPTDCQNGYFYVKNLETGNITKLVSQPIDVFVEYENGAYFIYGNSIFYVDYNGNIQKVFNSDSILNSSILELQNGNLYYCEGSKIVKYNINTQSKTTVARASNVSMLYIKSDNEMVYESNDEIYYVNNDSTQRSVREITDEYEYNSLFGEEEMESEISLLSLNAQLDVNLSNINSQYPAGSYFTNSGSKCTHHSSGCNYSGSCGCKSYLQTIQCVAFAKWASNQYAHLTTWNNRVAEGNDDDTYFSSDNDVKTYFANCGVAAYVRLTKSGYGDNGFHSIFYVKSTSTSIVTYECNLNGDCGVSHMTRTFYQFRKFAPGSSYYTTHHFSDTNSTFAQYNSTYHKQYCSNSSCSGYRLEAHYTSTPGSNALCVQCGYVGNITYTGPISE